jgi:hypothetical protein
MGERHQVYVKTPTIFDRHNGKNICRESTIVGVYHQYLFGQGPVVLLRNLLEFYKKHPNRPFGDANVFETGNLREFIESIYRSDRTLGYFSSDVCSIDMHEIDDPRDCANNHGITLVDLNSEKYCFMSVDGLEHIEARLQPPQMVPLLAHEYVSAYYPDYSKSRVRVNGKPASGKKTYGLVREAIADLSEYGLLSCREIRDMFPDFPVRERQPEPQPFDAVLGGDAPQPGDAVLGSSMRDRP